MTWHPDTPLHYRDQIVTGDARALAREIPDASVDLVFTDPVYFERELYDWLGREAQRILKPGGAVLCWSNGKWHRENTNWLEAAGLVYRYDFTNVMAGGPQPMCGRIIAKSNRVTWFDVDGSSRMAGYLADGLITVHGQGGDAGRWRWGKSIHFTLNALLAFTSPDTIVYDPFAGGGTIPAACKMRGRHYIASEIDPGTAERARERVLNTQPPLPGLIVEQLEAFS